MCPSGSLAIDWLRCPSLGVFAYWINLAIWELIDCNTYACSGTTKDDIVGGTLGIMRPEMVQWRNSEAKAGREHTLP
eukprot:9467516-Pyramimonas_sp.AAC.1